MAPGQREYISSRSRSPTPSRSPSPHSQLLPTFPSSRDTSSTSRGGQTSSLPSSSSTLLTTPTTKLSPRIPNDFTQRDRERELPQLPSSVSGRGVIDDSEGMSSSTSPNLSIGIANGGSSLRNRVASSPRILQGFRGDGGGGGDDEKTPTAVAGEKRQSQMSIVEKNLYPTRSRSSRSTNANAKSSGTPARNENECSGLLPPDPTVSPGESPSKPGTGFDSRGYPARSTSSPMIASMGGNSSLTSGSGSGSSWGLGGDTSSTGNPKLVGLGVISTPLSNTNTSTSSTRDRPRQVLPLTGPRPRKQESNHMVTSKSHSYYPTPSSSWEEENESESENTTLDFSYPPIHRSTGNNVDSEGTFGSGSRTGTYEEPSLRQESYHENLYISDHDPSISRPDSLYTTRAHSPASSFGSDAPFGGLNGWGLSAKPKRGSYVEPESGKGEYLDEEMTVSSSYDTVAGAGADGSESGFKGLKQGGLMQKEGSKSFASLESSRFTMGRELNTPDYEGLAGRWTLPVDLSLWSGLGPEADDDIHDPLMSDRHKSPPGWRGFTNIGCISILILGLLVLFAGWPIISFGQSKAWSRQGSYNLGGINATGQLPAIMGNFGLIDEDTPDSASSFTSMETGKTWQLVFSDEFNRDGRSFYPGDDPYWEASDLHYWGTNNLEWYDPRAITTENGSLVITLSNIPTHGLDYQGGMMTTWNKFCFTGGYLEVNVSLPGTSDVYGLWPAIWTLGNLGRAGYGGSLEGLWPYSYNECDVGTLPNQTLNNLPEAALTDGDPQFEMALSYLSGQRLSRCTCTNDETHPGPKNPDGSFVGRAAPEIDVFEAQVCSLLFPHQRLRIFFDFILLDG